MRGLFRAQTTSALRAAYLKGSTSSVEKKRSLARRRGITGSATVREESAKEEEGVGSNVEGRGGGGCCSGEGSGEGVKAGRQADLPRVSTPKTIEEGEAMCGLAFCTTMLLFYCVRREIRVFSAFISSLLSISLKPGVRTRCGCSAAVPPQRPCAP